MLGLACAYVEDDELGMGAAAVLARENSFRFVLSSAWISMPTVSSQSFRSTTVVDDGDGGVDDTDDGLSFDGDNSACNAEGGFGDKEPDMADSDVKLVACLVLWRDCCALL